MNKNLLLAFLSAVVFNCMSQAPDTVISQTDIGQNWYSGSTAGGGQSFTIQNEGKLTAFRFYTHQPEGSTVVELREGQNVNGNLLYTDTVDVNAGGWFTVSFPEIALCPGIYSVLLYDFQWGASNLSNPYSGGSALFGGGWQPTMDMAFEVVQIVENIPPVPDAPFLEDFISACPVGSLDLIVPSATDCSPVTVTNNAVFPLTSDTTIITWTYTDGNGGITTQDQRIIKIADTTPPFFLQQQMTFISACPLYFLSEPSVFDCSGEVTITSDAVFPIAEDTTVVTWTFADIYGNTSSTQQTIIIAPFNLDVTVSGNVFTASYDNNEGAEFKWLDCSAGYSVLAGETSASFEFTGTAGSFAVEIQNTGCADTSDCISVDFLSLEKLYEEQLQVFPNPASDQLNIGLNEDLIVSASLSDIRGRVIWTKAPAAKKLQADLSGLQTGTYILRIISDNGKVYLKKVEKL